MIYNSKEQCTCTILDSTYPKNANQLCDSCFIERTQKHVKKQLPKVIRGNTLTIALSMGKDSLVLLDILYHLRKKLKIGIITITVDEGINGFTNDRKSMVYSINKRYPSITANYISFKEVYGYTLDELVTLNREKGLRFTPCAICGILRRHIISKWLKELGVFHIAFGFTLNDLAQNHIINLLRGQSHRNKIMKKYIFQDNIIPPRIKPLAKLSEDIIIRYAKIMSLSVNWSLTCPNQDRSLRYHTKNFIYNLLMTNREAVYNLIMADKDKEKKIVPLSICKNCGSLTPSNSCSACQLIKKIVD